MNAVKITGHIDPVRRALQEAGLPTSGDHVLYLGEWLSAFAGGSCSTSVVDGRVVLLAQRSGTIGEQSRSIQNALCPEMNSKALDLATEISLRVRGELSGRVGGNCAHIVLHDGQVHLSIPLVPDLLDMDAR